MFCLASGAASHTCRTTVRSSPALSRRAARMAPRAAAAGGQEAFTVVGKGRIGSGLAAMNPADTLVGRGEPISEEGAGQPIIVCTRNDDLPAVVAATPDNRKADLVFIQNGMLQPWLADQGLASNTQVLVYFAVAKKGEPPADGKTDTDPEGLTSAWGRHAEAFAARLHANGLSCHVLEEAPFQQRMLEKLVWISAYMLVGVLHNVTVGEVEGQHKEEVDALVEELAAGGAEALGLGAPQEGLTARLAAYSRSVAAYPTALKEFPWRNGWFAGLSRRAGAEGRPDPFPRHTAALREAGQDVEGGWK